MSLAAAAAPQYARVKGVNQLRLSLSRAVVQRHSAADAQRRNTAHMP